MMGDTVALQAFLEERQVFQNLFSGGSFVTGRDGIATAAFPFVAERIGVNYAERDFMAAALKDGKAAIGKPVIGKVLGVPTFGMAMPIRNPQGQVMGALVGATNLGLPNFLDEISQNQYSKTGNYLLIAPKYRLIVTSSDKNRIMETLPAAGISPKLDRFINGFEGSDVFVNPVGVEVLNSAKSIPVAGWYVAATLSTEEAFAPIHEMQRRLLLAASLLTLLTGGLIWWILRRQLAPMLAAVKTLAALSKSAQLPQPLPITRPDEIGELIGGFNGLLEVMEQRAAALRESEARYHSLFENSHAVMLLIDPDGGTIITANPAASAFYGWPQEQLQGMRIDQINVLPPAEVAAEMQRAQAQQRNGFEFRHRLADGQVRDVEVFSGPMQVGDKSLLYSIVHDISDRKQAARQLAESEARRQAEMSAALKAQQQGQFAALNLMEDAIAARTSAEEALSALARLSRLYATLSQSNLAIVRCNSEAALFPQICREAVNFGGLKMAWIGLVDETGQKIMPVASFGDATDYLANALLSMDAENPRGQGPTATAIREDRPVWCQDFLHDPRTAPWHEGGARAGWMASASLPLRRAGVIVGALTLYAGEANFFDDAIRKLLVEMAADISFAMDSYAAMAERKRAEAQLIEQLDELRRWQQAMLNREGRILAMKKEINDLLAAHGQPPRYPSAADEGQKE